MNPLTGIVEPPPKITPRGLRSKALAPVYKPLTDSVFVRGEGVYLWDADGTQFLDLTSGIGVLALGHASEVVRQALTEAATRPLHTSNLILTEPPARLADALTDRSFADHVFFANSGTEANEGAIKFARHATPDTKQTVVYFDRSFHGRTYASLAATDRLNKAKEFGPLPSGFRPAPWNCEEAYALIDESTAAVLVEPVQGEGGVRPASTTWLRGLRARCDEVGALLIFDEVQCSVGRTGTLWAYEQSGVQPDLLTAAKPLAGGLPIGAVLMTAQVAEQLKPGCHGSTFGGGPAVTHVACAVLEHVSDEAFLAEVRRKGGVLMRHLQELNASCIQGIHGQGLMIGATVRVSPSRILKAAVEENLLLTAAGENVIRFLPPLIISDEEIEEAVKRFDAALTRSERE